MKPIIFINEHEYPAPNQGLGFTIKQNMETLVNANHITIGQRVGKDLHTVTNCVWQMLDATIWAKILQEFEIDPVVEIRFPDMIHQTWQTKFMVAQEQSAEVLEVQADGLPQTYRNCSMTLIDTGR